MKGCRVGGRTAYLWGGTVKHPGTGDQVSSRPEQIVNLGPRSPEATSMKKSTFFDAGGEVTPHAEPVGKRGPQFSKKRTDLKSGRGETNKGPQLADRGRDRIALEADRGSGKGRKSLHQSPGMDAECGKGGEIVGGRKRKSAVGQNGESAERNTGNQLHPSVGADVSWSAEAKKISTMGD